MKRIISLIILLSLLCGLLLSCANNTPDDPATDGPTDNENPGGSGGEGETPGGTENPNEPGKPNEPGESEKPDSPEVSDGINIASSEVAIYTSDDEQIMAAVANLIYLIDAEYGTRPTATDDIAAATVIFGTDAQCTQANEIVGYYEIEYKDGKLYVTASDAESLVAAKDVILSYAWKGGITVPKSINEKKLFNKIDYRTGKVTVYTEAEAEALPLLTDIRIGGESIASFSPMLELYTVKKVADYPTVTGVALAKNATVTVDAPTDENHGVATVTVSVGEASKSYSVIFYESISTADAEIVIKNGAEGTICFVIDDGGTETATFMLENILGKPGYENVTATFALITNKVATLKQGTDESGNLIWQTDENGRYVYEEIRGTFSFWRNILNTGKAAIISHTHTHTYPGENDGGGIFNYKKNDGTYTKTSNLPINNIIMEHRAARQIVEDISGEESYCLVTPGVGAPTPTFVSRSILKNGYLLARGTFGAGNATINTKFADYVFFAEDMLTESRLRSVPAYMIEHFASSSVHITDESSTNRECLDAGIDNWTAFIDKALELGGWASFCLHEIKPDTFTGSAHHIYQSQAKALFAYANSVSDRAWIATYDDAARYYVAWAHSSTKAEIIDGKIITVTLETNSDDTRLDVPLTVKVKLPGSWLGAKLGTEELEVRYDDRGAAYVLVDLSAGESCEIVCTGFNATESTEPTV